VYLGGEHLPTFPAKAIYSAEKPSNYVRPRRQWANAKGSICSPAVGVVGFVRCWSPGFVTYWIISCGGFSLLILIAAAGVLEIQG